MCVCVCVYVCVYLVAQLCLATCDRMGYRLPGSSVHGIFWARILGELPFHPPGDLSDSGMEPVSLASPAL